jgi:RiboL-PSP-HEPN
MNQEVWRYRQRLDGLFKRTGQIQDLELQAHWARYLCVLTSGLLEVSVRVLFGQYARQASAPSVAKFVEERLEDFQSAKMNNICTLTRQFNPAWADKLELDTAGELKDAVDSIVANRHQIAHGRDVGISHAQMKVYYDRSVEVVELIRAWCDP